MLLKENVEIENDMLSILLLSCSSKPSYNYCSDPLGVEMILIDSGSFTMGARAGEVDTYPIHIVEITRDVCLMSTEVTQEMWSLSQSQSSVSPQDLDLPIHSVTWFETIQFANQLSLKAGLSPCYQIPPELTKEPIDISTVNEEITWNKECDGYRLPTESEWEYAARSGEKWNYSGGYNFDKYAVYKENSKGKPHPVKSMLPNHWGLYDMSGNVSEWVWDGYGLYSKGTHIDPTGSKNPKIRVTRGGAFSSPSELIRVDVRSADSPEWRFDWVGFRLARNLK